MKDLTLVISAKNEPKSTTNQSKMDPEVDPELGTSKSERRRYFWTAGPKSGPKVSFA